MRTIRIAPLALTALLFGCPSEAPPVAKTAAVAASMPASAPVEAPAAKPPEGSANDADLADGKRLFMTACANCHGPDGTGQAMRQMMPKIGDLTSAELHGRMSDDEISALIQNGRDKMPGFGSVLKPTQIASIIAYTRSLKE